MVLKCFKLLEVTICIIDYSDGTVTIIDPKDKEHFFENKKSAEYWVLTEYGEKVCL